MTEIAIRTAPTKAETSQAAVPQVSKEERLRVRAYELYEKRKGASGDAESDWYRAEAELESGGTESPK